MNLDRLLWSCTPDARALRSTSVALALTLAALPAAAQGQLWLHQLGTNANDFSRAAAPDGAGGVYASGSTEGSLGGPNAGLDDAWLARRDGAGNPIWIRQVGTSGSDNAAALAPDGAGGLYVCGFTTGSLVGINAGAEDAWLARYDSAGNQSWVRQLGTSAGDVARAVTPDGAGGVFVIGYSGGSLGGTSAGSDDAWLARYDGAGNQQWIRQLGTSGLEVARAAAPDGSGGVYLGGSTTGSLGGPSAGDWDGWLARYDSAGTQIWIRQVGTSVAENANAAAPDGSGGVYLSGYSAGSLAAPNAGAWDAWLARYDSAGNPSWVRQLGTGDNDNTFAAATDGAGGVFVSGYTGGNLGGPLAGAQDAWLARFDGAGNQQWIEQLGTTGADVAFAAAADGAGGLYLSGYTNGSLGGAHAGAFDAWVARFEGQCGVGPSYCSASSTSIPLCQAAIGATGSPSVSNPGGFTISSGSVPGGNLGICFFGDNGAASIPFGTLGGQVCVQGPFFRSGPKAGGGTPGNCNGAIAFTLQDLIASAPIVVAGAVIHAEIWARDPPNADGFLLSDGLRFSVCP
jgi:hypothetical protein